MSVIIAFYLTKYRISCCARVRFSGHHLAARDLVSRVAHTWRRVRAVSTLVSSRYFFKRVNLRTNPTPAPQLHNLS